MHHSVLLNLDSGNFSLFLFPLDLGMLMGPHSLCSSVNSTSIVLLVTLLNSSWNNPNVSVSSVFCVSLVWCRNTLRGVNIKLDHAEFMDSHRGKHIWQRKAPQCLAQKKLSSFRCQHDTGHPFSSLHSAPKEQFPLFHFSSPLSNWAGPWENPDSLDLAGSVDVCTIAFCFLLETSVVNQGHQDGVYGKSLAPDTKSSLWVEWQPL